MDETQKTEISAFFSPTMILLGNNAVDRIGAEAKKIGRIKGLMLWVQVSDLNPMVRNPTGLLATYERKGSIQRLEPTEVWPIPLK